MCVEVPISSKGVEPMRASKTNGRVTCLAVAGCLLALIACSGQAENKPNATPDIDSGTTSPLDGSTPPVGDAGKVAKPKALGSPCTSDPECAQGLTCNTTFPGGLCTKACTADADCAGKRGSVGACINALCFAACNVEPDGG